MSGNRGKGRPKGALNKTTVTVKEALQKAYASIGGDKTFAEWASGNQTEFYKLWNRMLPQEVSGPDGGPIEFEGIARQIIKANPPSDR